MGTSNFDELTSPASIITEEEIEARGQSYISDLLRSLPGISVSSQGSRSGLTQIRMRGTEGNHVLVLIDGIEVSNPKDGEFFFSGLRSEDIVRIEVLRGEQGAHRRQSRSPKRPRLAHVEIGFSGHWAQVHPA